MDRRFSSTFTNTTWKGKLGSGIRTWDLLHASAGVEKINVLYFACQLHLPLSWPLSWLNG